MKKALIGFSGFVGSTLLKQAKFNSLYRSTNISEIDGMAFDTVVCAGAPAQKWIANLNPDVDRQKIDELISHLKTISSRTFILISTVDVFKNPIEADEATEVNETKLHAYGLHRRLLEKFVEDNFSKHLIVRLPGLVGPGLRKNVIFDLLNNNDLKKIDSRNIFQFYPMVNLWPDIQIALNAGLRLIHLTAEPISVADVAKYGFDETLSQNLVNPPVRYDLRTLHSNSYGLLGHYQYSARETIQAIRAYAQSEPHKDIIAGTKA